MKQPKCRLCNHEHGLSEPHVFTTSYSSDEPLKAPKLTAEQQAVRKAAERDKTQMGFAKRIALDPFGKKKDSGIGGKEIRRAKASGPGHPSEKTADEAAPPLGTTQAQSVEPSRKDSIATLKSVLTKGLSAGEKKELSDVIAALEARRKSKRNKMQRYRNRKKPKG